MALSDWQLGNLGLLANGGKRLPVTGDRTQAPDWTYGGDIVEGLLLAAKKDELSARHSTWRPVARLGSLIWLMPQTN